MVLFDEDKGRSRARVVESVVESEGGPNFNRARIGYGVGLWNMSA